MGREIRKVPKGWEHPRGERGNYKPMLEEFYIDVLDEWSKNHLLWLKGEHPYQKENPDEAKKFKYFVQAFNDPPGVDDGYNLHKWKDDEAVCFQMYETISEGTPVSPVFDTLKELENWLVKKQGYDRKKAEEFCQEGWTPSFFRIDRSQGHNKGPKR